MSARWWLIIAVIYVMIGIGVGIFMSSTLQLKWASAHAHVNLVGWASTAIMGLTYGVFPDAGKNNLGKLHFWSWNIGAPIFLISAFLVQVKGMLDTAHILTFTGAGLMGLGLIVFLINLFTNVKDD